MLNSVRQLDLVVLYCQFLGLIITVLQKIGHKNACESVDMSRNTALTFPLRSPVDWLRRLLGLPSAARCSLLLALIASSCLLMVFLRTGPLPGADNKGDEGR